MDTQREPILQILYIGVAVAALGSFYGLIVVNAEALVGICFSAFILTVFLKGRQPISEALNAEQDATRNEACKNLIAFDEAKKATFLTPLAKKYSLMTTAAPLSQEYLEASLERGLSRHYFTASKTTVNSLLDRVSMLPSICASQTQRENARLLSNMKNELV